MSAVPCAHHGSEGIKHTVPSGVFGTGSRQPQSHTDPLSGKDVCGTGVSILKGT